MNQTLLVVLVAINVVTIVLNLSSVCSLRRSRRRYLESANNLDAAIRRGEKSIADVEATLKELGA